MKTKLLTICLLLFTSQAFALEECKGTNVSKWDNCIGEQKEEKENKTNFREDYTVIESKGPYKTGMKNGIFVNEEYHEIIHKHDGNEFKNYGRYNKTGVYKDGAKIGLWGECKSFSFGQSEVFEFEIGNYNKHGVKDGIWGLFMYRYYFSDSSAEDNKFVKTGCYKKTVELFMDKEELCSRKKDSHFAQFLIYEDGLKIEENPSMKKNEEGYFIGYGPCRDVLADEFEKKAKNTDPEYTEWIKNFE